MGGIAPSIAFGHGMPCPQPVGNGRSEQNDVAIRAKNRELRRVFTLAQAGMPVLLKGYGCGAGCASGSGACCCDCGIGRRVMFMPRLAFTSTVRWMSSWSRGMEFSPP
jgi:hypothetical protein